MISVTFKNCETDSTIRFEWNDGQVLKWYNERQSSMKWRLKKEPATHDEFENYLRQICLLGPKWELWKTSKPELQPR